MEILRFPEILPVIIILVILIYVLTRNASNQPEKAKPEVRPEAAPAHKLEEPEKASDEISLAGGSLVEGEPSLEKEYQRMDGKEELMVTTAELPRKNGKPH